VIGPGGDGCCGFFWGSAAGVYAVCDVAAEPLAEFDLFIDVAASPGRALMRARRSSSGQSSAMTWMSAIQRRAGSSEMRGDERAEQCWEPEAPVTMNSGLNAVVSPARPHWGQTAWPSRGSISIGLSQDWQ
jgi:hypothetical protein